MSQSIALCESEATAVELSEEGAAALLDLGKRLASKRQWWGDEEPVERSVIDCSRQPSGSWSVTVREAIGVIRAGDVQLAIRPKIPGNHFVYLATQSELFPRIEEAEVAITESEELWELIVRWFLAATESLLRSDVAKGYAEETDDLEIVRGRVIPLATARHFYQGRPLAACEYEEFTTDIALNRVIKAAAEVVVRSPVVPKALRQRGKAIVSRLAEVGPLSVRDLTVRVDRLTQRYEDALGFAKQLLGRGGVDLSHGGAGGWSFLIRTPELVEAGVRAILRRRLAGSWSVEKRSRTLGERRVTFNPDLVFGRDEAVGDVKYKLSAQDWVRSDLFQAIGFAAAFRTRAACLIGFQRHADQPTPSVIDTGDIEVSYFAWPTDCSPLQAEERVVQQISVWLGKLRPRLMATG